MSVTLKDEKITERWGTVVANAAGHGQKLLSYTQQYLQQSQLPGVQWQIVEATPSMFKGLLGKRRDYLLITNQALKDWRMYFGARDYGIHLDVSWFVTLEPGFFKKTASSLLAHGNANALSYLLDIFDQQDLSAYVGSVHHYCVKGAVTQLVEELGHTTAGFDWRSKGFLQVW